MSALVFLSEYQPDFGDEYLAMRQKEGRVLGDAQVKLLPDAGYDKRHTEWRIRQRTSSYFITYISKHTFKKILEVGCGNGWFSNLISKTAGVQVTGVDINKPELEQAIRVFGNSNPVFYYGDIFKDIFAENQFDLIVLNGCVQYFPDFAALIKQLRYFLSDDGEIHILDSPFYTPEEVKAAQLRSLTHFTNIGFPGMAAYYFHKHTGELEACTATYLYKPTKSIVSRLLGRSPFPWVKIQKTNSISV